MKWLIIDGVVMLTSVAATTMALPGDLENKARTFLSAVARGDVGTAVKAYDDAMTKALPGEKLRGVWKDLVMGAGAFKKLGAAKTGKAGAYDIVTVRCDFEKKSYNARVVFDADQRITGLFFSDASEYKYTAPAYVNRADFTEMTLQVGSGKWSLPATVTVPKNSEAPPTLVLIQGSGPSDRDETIGPNKAFRDLAWGLAGRGVATLRFDKRSKAHPAQLMAIKNLTVKEDVLDDALAAVDLVRKTPRLDPQKVFVLGHSLGATAAPKLAEIDPAIAGIILMAAGARPIDEVVGEQLDYLLSLEINPSEKDKAKVEKIKKDAARITDPTLTPEELVGEKLLGASFLYWRSVRGLEPTVTALKIKQPMLVLQGGRDYQVTMADFDLWKKALADRPNVVFKSYPRLNHLFMEGDGKAIPAEYDKEGHVAREVIDDVAAWVKKH